MIFIKRNIFCLAVLFFLTVSVSAQVENVPLDHDVYTFLKEMKIKKIISSINDDNPNLSRFQVLNFLKQIKLKQDELSVTETNLLDKFITEFDPELYESNSNSFVGGNLFEGLFSDKLKHIYSYKQGESSFYLEGIGHYVHGQKFKDRVNNAELYDVGFNGRGTILGSLGYSLSVLKGGVSGSLDFAEDEIDPRLAYNFKFIENIENIGNYDYTTGYLKYYARLDTNMNFSLQIGREKIKFGLGYGSRLVISGDHPNLDFIKLNFNWGVFSFTSIHASAAGEFDVDRTKDYTKYFAINRFKLSFPDLFDIALGENIIYSDRFDIGYLNPLIFYKFAEMSLQDRDNGTVFFDLQTNFIKNLELQGTFFLDENILSHLSELDLFSNKTAYQLGAFWYQPFGINDASLVFEYTRIRPFVYSHYNFKNTYSSFGQILGHRAGGNADEMLTRLTYNLSSRLRLETEYIFTRSGENVYDTNGNLIKNVGGDYLIGHRDDVDSKYAYFLDGIRINRHDLKLHLRYELLREIFADFIFRHIIVNNAAENVKTESSFLTLKISFEY